MKDPPLVSVVILSWNRIDDLRHTLQTLREDSYPRLEVIVVDNASTDGTPAMVRSDFPEVRLIELESNIGIAGWNTGFEIAQGDYVLVLDDDSYPEAAAIVGGVEYLDTHPECGIAGFRIRNLRLNRDETTVFTPGPVLTFIGCGAMIRTRVIRRIGGFDRNLFLYEHETEFSMRAWNAGFEVHYCPEILIFHRATVANRGIRGTRDCRRVYYTARNVVYVMLLHFSLPAVQFRLFRLTMGRFLGGFSAGCIKPVISGLFRGWVMGCKNRSHSSLLHHEIQRRYKFGAYAGGFYFDDPAYAMRRRRQLKPKQDVPSLHV
ncbi:MAG: glycosyltransferase family 2 protein [Bacteroidetes bacterium]|nr:glycosyltransferase family 2 protein [Bacteroidota bacterium]